MKIQFIGWKKAEGIAEISTAVRHHKGKWALAVSPDFKGFNDVDHVWEATTSKCSHILGLKNLISNRHGGIFLFKTEEQMNHVFKLFASNIQKNAGIVARKFNPNCEMIAES